MAATLSMTLALSACASTVPTGAVRTAAAVPLTVTNNGQPFAFSDGAAAKRVAMEDCAAEGRTLRTSIYDRFDAGTWVYPEGCA
jgi:hypothetical protein